MGRYVKILLCLALCMPAATQVCIGAEEEDGKPFSRGIDQPKTIFIPRGTVAGALTCSYNEMGIGNGGPQDVGYKMLFSLLDGLYADLSTWGIAPSLMYFPVDNIGVGLRFDYGKTYAALNGGGLSLMEGLSIDNFNYLKQSYSGSFAMRYYMPIMQSRRFGMYVEARATKSYAQSESYKWEEGEKHGTYQDINRYFIGLVPGVCLFVTENVALEVGAGVLGYNWQSVTQTTDQVNVSRMQSSGGSFKLNLLSIELTTSFYFPLGRHR